MTEACVKGWLETYNTADLDGAMACYTDDVEFEDPIFGELVHGKPALRQAFSQFFFSGVTKLRFLEWSGGPVGGAVEWEWTATWGANRTFLGFDASHKRFVVRGVTVLKLRDGKISHQTDYWDARGALRQLGGLQ
ncbi:MAG: hypothetical protein FJ147_00435 [Deltaproteobacteria bacterium]|nr:hypothetical protein [Deltaproteobacteria bacterium]